MIKLKIDIRSATRGFDAFARRQVPFALAQALNAAAKAGIEAERAALRKDIDRPRPFTVNSGLRLKAARKSDLSAVVYIPPIQARYLAPEIDGGVQVLGANKAELRPIDQATDRYGNLPRGVIARLKGRPDIFVGPVMTKAGIVNGVWQRIVQRSDRHGQRAEFVRRRGGFTRKLPDKADGEVRGLRLLIRFSAPVQVKTRYPFGQATITAAGQRFGLAFKAELAKAIASGR